MRGRACYSLLLTAVVVTCPLVCPLSGLLSRHAHGGGAKGVADTPVCPCCPRPAPRDSAPVDDSPTVPQAPASDCLCKGAIGAAERAWSIDVAEIGLVALVSLPAEVVAGGVDPSPSPLADDQIPLSGRERRILRASLRF